MINKYAQSPYVLWSVNCQKAAALSRLLGLSPSLSFYLLLTRSLAHSLSSAGSFRPLALALALDLALDLALAIISLALSLSRSLARSRFLCLSLCPPPPPPYPHPEVHPHAP